MSLNFLFDRNEPRSRDLYSLKRIADAILVDHLPFFPQIKVSEGMISVELTVMNRENRKPLVITFNDVPRFRISDGDSYHPLGHEPAEWTYRDGIARIYQAVLDALKHELDESFYFMERRIFDPHEVDGRHLKEELIQPECSRCGGWMRRR